MNYKQKYLKYKSKYLNIKKLIGGEKEYILPCELDFETKYMIMTTSVYDLIKIYIESIFDKNNIIKINNPEYHQDFAIFLKNDTDDIFTIKINIQKRK